MNQPGLLPSVKQLVSKPQNQEHRDTQISREESTDGEVTGVKDCETIAQEEDREDDDADIRCIWLKE